MRMYLLIMSLFVISFSVLVQNVFCQDTSVEYEEFMNMVKADREKMLKTPYLHPNEKSLQISIQKNIFVPMESVEVIYAIKNIALETRKYFTLGWLLHTECRIKGEEIQPPHNEINGLPMFMLRSNLTLLAEPNQIFDDGIQTINREHDMTLNGEYKIQMFHLDCRNFMKPEFLVESTEITSHENTHAESSSSKKYKVEWVKSNIITVKIDDSLINLSKVISLDSLQTYSKPSHGVSLLLVSDKYCYDNYGPIYLKIATKNISENSVSMIIDTKNILDVYELTLLSPGHNRDFRKPAKKDKSDVQKVDYTLYGQKLLSEKTKTPKPIVDVKSQEETAESVIVLNRIFDMSTDGIYGLIVTRKIIDSNGKEQIISSEPFPIRIGRSLTQDEIDESNRQRKLNGYDPDYPTWESRDGLFKVIAKFISVDKDIVTLEKIDGKKTTFNVSDLTKENQDYIKKQN